MNADTVEQFDREFSATLLLPAVLDEVYGAADELAAELEQLLEQVIDERYRL